MRVSFTSQTGKTLEDLETDFSDTVQALDMVAKFHNETEKMTVVILVSRFGHCLNDLLYRWRIGALPIDIVAVISNHMDYQKVVVNHDIPYYCIKVTKQNKAQAEVELSRVVHESKADLIVLATLYAGPLRSDMRRDVGPDHQHPSFLFTLVQGCKPLQTSV